MQYTCPKCGAIGGGSENAHYFCHKCPTNELMLPSDNGKIRKQYLELGKLREGYLVLSPEDVKILQSAYPNIVGDSSDCMGYFRKILSIPEPTKEEFTYPMWFKNKSTGDVLKFISLNNVEGNEDYLRPPYPAHTNLDHWERVDEPKTVTIEKWLIYSMDNPKIVYVWEGSVEYINYYVARNACGKLKLLDSYEVTL